MVHDWLGLVRKADGGEKSRWVSRICPLNTHSSSQGKEKKTLSWQGWRKAPGWLFSVEAKIKGD